MSEERNTIYLCLAHMSEEGWEQKYVKEAFDTNWVVPLGPNVNEFEHELEKFVNEVSQSEGGSRCEKGIEECREVEKGIEECREREVEKGIESTEGAKVVALSSGTAAVHLALLACGVGRGDEVCVQSFTFCASSHPITYLGAKPVFIGSEPDTWNMDPDLLEAAILDRKEKTGQYPKAIVPVALYGMPYNVDRIMEISHKYHIPVIEDAAEGFGSRWKGRALGTFGRFGVLSFNGNKMITTSGGGALICNSYYVRNEDSRSEGSRENEEQRISASSDAHTIMWYATQARDSYPYYQHSAIGYNYRMSNICAGIGRGQMKVAAQHIAHHQHIQALYEVLLRDVNGVEVHKAPSEDCSALPLGPRTFDSNFWLCTITIDPKVRVKGQENAYKEVIKTAVGGAAGVIHMVDNPTTDCQPNDNVEALRTFLLSKKIEARPVWKPMHKQPAYNEMYEKSNAKYENVVCYEGPKSCAYLKEKEVSEEIFKVGMCLPSGPWVTDEDAQYIVECIKEGLA